MRHNELHNIFISYIEMNDQKKSVVDDVKTRSLPTFLGQPKKLWTKLPVFILQICCGHQTPKTAFI